jgi:hypothetical protein
MIPNIFETQSNTAPNIVYMKLFFTTSVGKAVNYGFQNFVYMKLKKGMLCGSSDSLLFYSLVIYIIYIINLLNLLTYLLTSKKRKEEKKEGVVHVC